MTDLVLASVSPRRRELLGRLVRDFRVEASPVEEAGDGTWPAWKLDPLQLDAPFAVPLEADPRLWAWRKAADVASRGCDKDADILVVGADTVVVAQERLLGKPKNQQEAVEMLSLLRGKAHYVATGFALVKPTDNVGQTVSVGVMVTRVTMTHFSEHELMRYVATGESMDKAGAYALQGLGRVLVDKIEGCYTNVVGFPLCTVRQALAQASVQQIDYPDRGYCEYCPFMLPG